MFRFKLVSYLDISLEMAINGFTTCFSFFFKDPHSPLESNDFLRMVIEQKHDVFGMEHPHVQGGLKTLHLRTPF